MIFQNQITPNSDTPVDATRPKPLYTTTRIFIHGCHHDREHFYTGTFGDGVYCNHHDRETETILVKNPKAWTGNVMSAHLFILFHYLQTANPQIDQYIFANNSPNFTEGKKKIIIPTAEGEWANFVRRNPSNRLTAFHAV